ncbi:MAG: hypothetical protein ACXAC8_17010 [Candidatus Hodarchaeales archaeon]
MLQIETLEDERLLFSILTDDVPPRIREKILDIIEKFGEQRSI